VLSIGMGLTLLHHRGTKLILSAQTLTAPLRARGILPADAFTLRYDQILLLQFRGHPDRWDRNYQRLYTGPAPGQQTDINLGPVFRAAHEELAARVEKVGGKVERDD